MLKDNPLVQNAENQMLGIKRFLYRRDGQDIVFPGGKIHLADNSLNFVYVETPFNVLKKSLIDYPVNSVKIGRFLTSQGNIVESLQDDVNIIASDDSGGGSGAAQKQDFTFSLKTKNQSLNRWLEWENLYSNLQGLYFLNTRKIDSVFIKTNNNVFANFYIYKNVPGESALQPGTVPLVVINLNNENYKYAPGLDIDIYAGDFIKVYMEVLSGKIDYPKVNLEIKSL